MRSTTAASSNVPPLRPSRVVFSVIVPVYQHWHLVPVLLERLESQTLQVTDFEVIIVDNGSGPFDAPAQTADNTRVLQCTTPGSYAARNHGARHARGEWLVFTDADCLPARDWLEAFLEPTRTHGVRTLLAGAVEVVSVSPSPGIYEIYDLVNGIPQARYVKRGYAATANLAVARNVFFELDGFDPTRFSGGDAEFCRRAVKHGCRIRYICTASVEHPPRCTWGEIAGKTRRVKGGQLAAGSAGHRGKWLVGTLSPPLRGVWRFLSAARFPLRYRLIAVIVLFRVWLVELHEAFRLGIGGQPRRS